MKKHLLTLSMLLLCLNVHSQTSDSLITRKEFRSDFSKLSEKIKILAKNNSDLLLENSLLKNRTDSIAHQLSVARSNIQQIADSLHIAITNASSANIQNQSEIQNINQTITTRTLYWVICILLVAFFSMIVFFLLRNKLSTNTKTLDAQINKTNEKLQDEAVKLDSKLVEILQSQLNLLKEDRKSKNDVQSGADHKLPLKVGEEIHRMRKRIENMPQDVKGLSALTNSLQRLEEEFNSNGYEIENLLGMKYVDGMKIEARFVDNPNIPKGEEIITDVLRPQIKHNGLVIQVAKVEVGKS